MRTLDVLRCLAAIQLCCSARCEAIARIHLPDINVLRMHQDPSQAGEQYIRRQSDPSPIASSQPVQIEDLRSATDTPQSDSRDGSTAMEDGSPSSTLATVPATRTQPSSTTDLGPSTTSLITETTTLSTAHSPTTTAKPVSVSSSSTLIPSPTTSAISTTKEQPFQMSAASIAATVVLCSFVCAGTVIMVYYRTRGCRARRRNRRRSSVSPDNHGGLRHDSSGVSMLLSTASTRENMMYCADRQKIGLSNPAGRDMSSQDVTEQKPPYNHDVEHIGFPMMGVQSGDEAEHSAAFPLISPTLPRPISSISQKKAERGLRRKFSFEETQQTPYVPVGESSLNNRTALTSNPPSGWPLTTPFDYRHGLPFQSSQGYQPAAGDDGRSVS